MAINLNSLQKGARVQISGMDAGEVVGVEVPDQPDAQFRVKVKIQEHLHALVRTDSVATIKAVGLSENTFIDLQKGTGRSPEAPAGKYHTQPETCEPERPDATRQRLDQDHAGQH